jgi:hypothetical protein
VESSHERSSGVALRSALERVPEVASEVASERGAEREGSPQRGRERARWGKARGQGKRARQEGERSSQRGQGKRGSRAKSSYHYPTPIATLNQPQPQNIPTLSDLVTASQNAPRRNSSCPHTQPTERPSHTRSHEPSRP